MSEQNKFSVLMSVYKKENPIYLKAAIDSVINQTLMPSDIVVVCDGSLTDELEKVLDFYKSIYPELFNIVGYEKNQGLGFALNYGLQKCKYDLVARMDTDDISVKTRFELQVAFMDTHKNIDVLGGQIVEFYEEEIIAKREVPLNHTEIIKFIKGRNPFNHMTVMFRKSSVIKAGNYIDLHFLEDYYLWVRMLVYNCKFSNLDEILVYARTGVDMYKRRGGYKYFKSWVTLERYMLKNKLISRLYYYFTLGFRFFLQVVLPDNLRGFIFKKIARKKVSNDG
ncbi:glycosyltransferase [Longibaculum muris]|uniref:Glycosyl transferase family 2 n=1 Tax=Longibaculum muris TaxID=1796628 RepID=A0A4R3ZAK3_9FIRM|nr:glycosyltransferase [Longibaculum muris]KXU51588.1 putative amylovoran biosynthesis glycosyltransferase AmsE [Candidatus Stoquefichus sp. KLE1796]MBS5370526.1 glycosyltransferase [Coprobacillus cateniformis]MCR1886861.1 glycosyltransferase [Longibaculum muris]MED9813309.1 glycosyltransferase [Longibaculum muris]TCW02891.1 glycosyl transferase family 2 [Longibaculum muris]